MYQRGSHKFFSSATSGTMSGPAYVRRLLISNSGASNSVISIYDAAGATNQITEISVLAHDSQYFHDLETEFDVSLHFVATSAVSVTVFGEGDFS